MASSKQIVAVEQGPKPSGQYSAGVVAQGKFLFVAGQLPVEPNSGTMLDGDIARDTRQALENFQRVVEAAGASMADVVRMNVYLRNLGDFAAMNAVYAEFFPAEPPARTTIGCAIKSTIEVDGIVAMPA